MLAKMPPYMIDDNGIIKEWLTPRLENNDSHRHSSQLYPLLDGMPEEIAQSPELQAAFRKSIEYKLDKHWKNNQRGFMSFGLVQLGQAATSLGEGELAYHCLRHLVNRFWLNNLASMHNHRSLFNMDISGGMPAVIIKMLVASDVGKIQLLPALPAAWPAGRIEGVLCRGAIEIQSLEWKGKQITVSLTSAKPQTVTLDLPSEIEQLSVTGNAAEVSSAEHLNQRIVAVPGGQLVTMVIRLVEGDCSLTVRGTRSWSRFPTGKIRCWCGTMQPAANEACWNHRGKTCPPDPATCRRMAGASWFRYGETCTCANWTAAGRLA
jgi:hypothetical protein